MRDESFMKKKAVLPLIISMSLPMVISMSVNALYNIVDSYFIAKISEEAMTALSLIYPIQNLINAVVIGFGVGINALIAFYLGAKDFEKATKIANQGFLLSLIHGVVLTIGGIEVISPFLKAFTSDEQIKQFGREYCIIVFLFTIINSLNLFFEKYFQAFGNMKITMIGLAAGFLTNIVLDPVLIFGIRFLPRLEIKGAAIATCIGQLATFVIYIAYYLARPANVRINIKYLKFNAKDVGSIYSIGIPAILNLALPSMLISALNAILATFSQIYVLVLGVYYKLQTFLYLSANGIIQGMRPILSYNYGAKEYKRVKKIYTYVLIMIAGIMAVGTILCLALPTQIISLFTDSVQTIQAGKTALMIISGGFIVSAVSVASCGALEALNKGLASLIISLCRYTVIIIPVAFILSKIIGVQGVWHAFWITEALTAVISFIVYRKSVKMKY